MFDYKLYIELLSDTSFGRGDGINGVINSEVEHDPRTGLPFIKGRTIKGLLVEACADLLYGIRQSGSPRYQDLENIAQYLFGDPGSGLDKQGILHIGNGSFPEAFTNKVKSSLKTDANKSGFTPAQVLNGLTTIRYQTAVDPATDKPLDKSLRATRVVVRNTIFTVAVLSKQELHPDEFAFLCACAATVRRAGLNRSRGLGHVSLYFEGQMNELAHFAHLIEGGKLNGLLIL